MPQPPSAEAAVLHAVIEEDKPRVHDLLTQFTGPELVCFHHQLGLLIDLVTIEHQQRGPHVPTDNQGADQ